MEGLVGNTVYVLFTEIVEDGSTIRQAVAVYGDKKEACEDLENFAQDETKRLGSEHPDWVMADGSDTYFECCKDGDLHNNHSTAKIVADVIR